jgi:hypothetical protein
MGNQYDGEGGNALRSDLPGLSLRIPGSQSEVRFYGFANLNAYRDFNGRNQTDAPAAQTIPLANSLAAMQGGDFGLSARFSRIGIDTRTAIAWGTLETRLEGDFGGGAPAAPSRKFAAIPWGPDGSMSASNMCTYSEMYSAAPRQRPLLAPASASVTVSSAPSLQGFESSARLATNSIPAIL